MVNEFGKYQSVCTDTSFSVPEDNNDSYKASRIDGSVTEVLLGDVFTDPNGEKMQKEGQEYTPCTTNKRFDFKIYAALEVNSWYLFVQIKYTWRLVHINAYMISCAPINLYL